MTRALPRGRSRRFSRARGYGAPFGLVMFLLPALVVYAALSVVPSLLSVIYSLVQWQGLTPVYSKFNGFRFYVRALHDPVVWSSLVNNGRALALFTLVTLPVALGLAFILSHHARGVSFFRAVFFIPVISSVALLALVFRLFFTTDSGFNGLLTAVGLKGFIRPWLSTAGLTEWLINAPQTWVYVGFWVVIFVAAIKGVDPNLHEAATIDGAGRWQQFRHITLPSIRPVLLFAYVMTVVFALQAGIYQIIVPGPEDPGGPLNSTHTLGSYAYTYVSPGIRGEADWGYASTLSVFLFVLAGAAGLLVGLANRRRDKSGSGESG